MTAIQWVYLFTILLITFAGGFFPLFKPERARREEGFPLGQAFTAGVFLALALTLMLPSAFHLMQNSFPDFDFPIASVITIGAFVLLLWMEHASVSVRARWTNEGSHVGLSPASIPVIMTTMIAVPSFFLGAALGISSPSAALFIFIAIIAHKSSAAFGLALTMVRSRLTRAQTLALFSIFACSTPLGILVGAEIHQSLGTHTMLIIKGCVLSLAGGTFLYMATLHELRRTPLIEYCGRLNAFLVMLSGFAVTALVRFLIGEAHRASM